MGKDKVTVEDIARAAGVSPSTVSRVINRSTPVSDELNEKVEGAIQRLGFKTARSRAPAAPTSTIVMAVPEFTPYTVEIIQGAQDEAERIGFNVGLFCISENPQKERTRLATLKLWKPDGVIFLGGAFEESYLVSIRDWLGVPVVVGGRSTDFAVIPSVQAELEDGTFQAARYLLGLGHRRLAFISGPPEWSSSIVRRRGIERALAETGAPKPDLLVHWCFSDIDEGFYATQEILRLPAKGRPTAIMAFDDMIAMGALHAVAAAGLRVPEDISVVGCDDISAAAHTNPPLTTIDQPKYRIGQAAVQIIQRSLQGKEISNSLRRSFLPCSLVVRKSAGPCDDSRRWSS